MPVFWRDFVRPSEHLDTLRERRRDVYERIDEQKFGWKIVLVAGAGFLTDAYDIFAVNMVLPMLEIVYWQNSLPPSHETAINLATLVGTIIGQLTFGLLADRYGRKKMYGFELLIVIVATVGLALCSVGISGSINVFAWVICWRLLMGVGIGADYPLSAVIVSEFSPRKHRARMLAAVFYMQPVGQLVANVVTIIATSVSRQYISQNSDPSNCQGDCLETTDKIWRWIVGLGAILPALAMLARLYIPESPRYLLEVEKDSHTAQLNAEVYFVDYEEDPFQEPDDEEHLEESQVAEQETAANNEPSNFEDIQMEEYPNQDNIAIEEYHRADPLAQPSIGDPRMIPDNGPRSDSTLNVGWASTTAEPPFQKDGTVQEIHSLAPSDAGGKDITDLEKFQLPSPGLEPSGQPSAKNTGDSKPAPQGELRTRKASLREFWKGFGKFLFDRTSVDMTNIEGFNDVSTSDLNQDNNLNNVDQHPRSWTDGNWTDLAGTAFSWFLLDLSFFFLGVNSWKITAMVWNTPTYDSVYQFIIQLSWRTMISISLSSLLGGALFIAMARYRHNLQTYGFLILAAFFIALGATFVTILGGQYFAAIIMLYFFTQLFFDFGPNTSTFIIPAEVFPTQYRATCHGISAACGKLGSIIAQVIAQVFLNADGSQRLGHAMMIFSALMVLGAYITKLWVPKPCDIYGESRSLEDLSKGKRVRKQMEQDEKIELRNTEKARYGNV